MAKITQAECEAKGFNWNPTKKTCSEPDISNIKMGIGRGDGCDGGTRIVEVQRRLPREVRLALIKAVKGVKGTSGRGKKKRPARRAKPGA